jgi:hypothetical protein
MNGNSKLDSKEKGKAVCYPEHVGSSLAAQSDKKGKFPWSPPPPDWIKLNVDAGFDPHSGHAGISFIARNHVGKLLFSGWSSDKRCRLAEEAECLATWVGLKHTLASWNGRLWLESDCFATVCYLKDECRNRYESCHIIEEAKRVLQLFQNFRVSRCDRSANEVAHELYQFGRRELSNVFIANGIPTCVSAALAPACNNIVLI